MENVGLSFIVPVYNVAPYLRKCVDSLLAQDYDDYEIILVDDGSTDRSGAICDEYARVNELENERVRELRNRLHDYLESCGIGTVIHYPIAPHKQECYSKEAWNIPQLSVPITEYLADAELSIPISPCMSIEQVEHVVKCINAFK